MTVEFLDIVIPALVTLALLPGIQYVSARRTAQAQGAFEARRIFYEEILNNLIEYFDYVKWLPPNMRGPRPDDEEDDDGRTVVLTRANQVSMRLHASPILRLRVNELLAALEESKWQSDHMMRERAKADALPKDTFEREWAHDRAFQHSDRKSAADKWAEECLERIRYRMRYELYGWYRWSPHSSLIARRAVGRVRENKTDIFSGGGVPYEPPPGRREMWEASRKPPGDSNA